METNKIFITQLNIEKVRHLKNIIIPLYSTDESADKPEIQEQHTIKHLLITGKNGSGKTSVLDALEKFLDDTCENQQLLKAKKQLPLVKNNLENQIKRQNDISNIVSLQKAIKYYEETINRFDSGIIATFNQEVYTVNEAFQQGEFILAYFKAERTFEAKESKHVEKVELKDTYKISDNPREDFVKYLVDKKVSQSLYQTKNETKKAEELANWFKSFEQLLQDIYGDPTLFLDFDVDSFSFHIKEREREDFNFNTMSAGYAAILDIVVNIIMRMEHHTGGTFNFTMPGIVLIDELETHLHYTLQKAVLPFLCKLFPNIQFIVSTHSAFILSSIPNAVIYDLENRKLVKDGLAQYPYEGIIEGYFDVSTLSKKLKGKFERYKELVKKQELSKTEYAELAELNMYLEEIPDYLALDITTEYKRLEQEFVNRGHKKE